MNAKTNESKITTLDDAPATKAKTESEATPAAKALAAGVSGSLSGEKKIVTIHPHQGEGGSDDVFIGLNGYSYVIKRGKPVEVPAEVVQILENATQTIYDSKDGGGSQGREVPRFAFSVK